MSLSVFVAALTIGGFMVLAREAWLDITRRDTWIDEVETRNDRVRMARRIGNKLLVSNAKVACDIHDRISSRYRFDFPVTNRETGS